MRRDVWPSFNAGDVAEAYKWGKARNDYAKRKGYKNKYDTPASDTEMAHIVGVAGELAAAFVLELPWDPTVGRIDASDLPGGIEVRCRRVPGVGPDLCLLHGNKSEPPWVLAHCWDHVDKGLLCVKGWLYGHEVMVPEFHHDLPRYKPHGAWFAPPDRLRDIFDLKALIRR